MVIMLGFRSNDGHYDVMVVRNSHYDVMVHWGGGSDYGPLMGEGWLVVGISHDDVMTHAPQSMDTQTRVKPHPPPPLNHTIMAACHFTPNCAVNMFSLSAWLCIRIDPYTQSGPVSINIQRLFSLWCIVPKILTFKYELDFVTHEIKLILNIFGTMHHKSLDPGPLCV